MLCLLSPAKTMSLRTPPAIVEAALAVVNSEGVRSPAAIAMAAEAGPLALTVPRLEAAATVAVQRLKQLSVQDLMARMKISKKLGEQNHERYAGWETADKYPCGYLFDGVSFRKGINVEGLDEIELAGLQQRVCIISGLYGVLRPLDLIRPYRLEMGYKIDFGAHDNPYKFWEAQDLTASIAALAGELDAKFILNCASEEYSKAVDFDALRNVHGLTVVDFTPKAGGGGGLASAHVKQARGFMCRFVAQANPQTIEDLEQFDGYPRDVGYGFRLSKQRSGATKLVFEKVEHDSDYEGDGASAKAKGKGKAKAKAKAKAEAKPLAKKRAADDGPAPLASKKVKVEDAAEAEAKPRADGRRRRGQPKSYAEEDE